MQGSRTEVPVVGSPPSALARPAAEEIGRFAVAPSLVKAGAPRPGGGCCRGRRPRPRRSSSVIATCLAPVATISCVLLPCDALVDKRCSLESEERTPGGYKFVTPGGFGRPCFPTETTNQCPQGMSPFFCAPYDCEAPFLCQETEDLGRLCTKDCTSDIQCPALVRPDCKGWWQSPCIRGHCHPMWAHSYWACG
jgi:hypothetical protein